jgi:hypothetical protein
LFLLLFAVPLYGEIPVFPQLIQPKTDFWQLKSGGNLQNLFRDDPVYFPLIRRYHGVLSKEKETEVEHYLQENYPRYKLHPEVAWSVVNMSNGEAIAWQPDKCFEGASVVKVYSMASLLGQYNGYPLRAHLREFLPLISVSSNSAWTNVIRAHLPMPSTTEEVVLRSHAMGCYKRIQSFLFRHGYRKTRGGRISIGAGDSVLTARELARYLFDVQQEKISASFLQMKLMATCSTSDHKGNRYIPDTIFGGGKTGTWQNLAHDMRWYEVNGTRYGISVLTQLSQKNSLVVTPCGENSLYNETVAILHGGLLREYILEEPGVSEPSDLLEDWVF